MGFSVSAATAIVFIAAFVSVGVLYSAGYAGFEQVEAATDAKHENALQAQNTAINITDVVHDADQPVEYVNLTVVNQGSTTLSVNATDVLLNGTYQKSYVTRTVSTGDGTVPAGSGGTDLWLPGETLRLSIQRNMSAPIHVYVVTETGVTATEVSA
ncbi:MAG: fla cluster protein FlaF [Halanaeroarchaeum sp.]